MDWWTFISDLQPHLAAALTGADVVYGASGVVPTSRTARLKYGEDEDTHINQLKLRGVTTLLIECWEYHATDSAAAYAALASLHDEVITALRAWKPSGYVFEVMEIGILGDDDVYRPSVGSEISVRLSWRRTQLP